MYVGVCRPRILDAEYPVVRSAPNFWTLVWNESVGQAVNTRLMHHVEELMHRPHTEGHGEPQALFFGDDISDADYEQPGR